MEQMSELIELIGQTISDIAVVYLGEAHQNLDKAVDKAYSSKNFATETERMEFLFGLYNRIK